MAARPARPAVDPADLSAAHPAVVVSLLVGQPSDPLLARVGASAMLRPDGALHLHGSEAEFKASLPGWRLREQHGIGFEHVRGARLAALQPGLSAQFDAATSVPKWQTISDPYELVCRVGEDVEGRGAELIMAEAADLASTDGAARLILADGRVLVARQVVVAAGAWSKRLAGALGDAIPLETERGYNTTLQPDAFDLRRQLIFGGHGFVVTPLGCGIRIGGAVELAALRSSQTSPARMSCCARRRDSCPDFRPQAAGNGWGFGHPCRTRCRTSEPRAPPEPSSMHSATAISD